MKARDIFVVGLILLICNGLFMALFPIKTHNQVDEVMLKTSPLFGYEYEVHRMSYTVIDSSPVHIVFFTMSSIGALLGFIMVVISLWRLVEPINRI